ncbi:hypothetical protein QTV44_000320 [Vibrio vulnificus]|nr:hypothetical protein [Vibrio vulnificus]
MALNKRFNQLNEIRFGQFCAGESLSVRESNVAEPFCHVGDGAQGQYG